MANVLLLLLAGLLNQPLHLSLKRCVIILCTKRAAAVARDRVANVLLAYKGKGTNSAGTKAAEDIARATARELLGPLLDAVCARLGFILRHVFDMAADAAMATGGWEPGWGASAAAAVARRACRPRFYVLPGGLPSSLGTCATQSCPRCCHSTSATRTSLHTTQLPAGPSCEALQLYVAFHAALRSAHQAFAARLEGEARRLLSHHLDAATSEFALSLMAPLPGEGLGGGEGHAALAAVQQQLGSCGLMDTENVAPGDENGGPLAAAAQVGVAGVQENSS